MRDMATIADLQQAQEDDPALVEKYLEQVSFLPDLMDYLEWLHKEHQDTKVVSDLRRHKSRPRGIHPSAACKTDVCPLKLYFDCTNEVEPFPRYDAKSQEIWDLGTMMHDRAQTLLKNMYKDRFASEVPLAMPEILLVGHTDGLWTFKGNKKLGKYRIVLELKSIKEGGNYGWAKVQEKPFADNVRQAHFYMKALDVPFGIIAYMCKNTGDMKEHPVVFDPDIWADLMRIVVPVVAKVVKGTKAKVVAKPGWHCKQCDYFHGCTPGKEKHAKGKGIGTWTRR